MRDDRIETAARELETLARKLRMQKPDPATSNM